MADKKSDDQKQVFFQTAVITFLHPESGDKITRNFVGQAFFTPEELARFGDTPVEDIFHGFSLDQPYNPYEDENNAKAHINLTNKVREALDNDSG